MKLMIASDLHGSAYYARLLLKGYEKEQPDKLIFLGDMLYHGPRNKLPRDYAPSEVIDMLNPLASKLLCVRGNCDAEVDQMMLCFPMMADYALVLVDGLTLFATHGYLYHTGNLPPLSPGDILLHGHTHVPAWEETNQVIYLNPGSVSMPKEDSAHSYMAYENRVFAWKDLEGNVYHTYAAH